MLGPSRKTRSILVTLILLTALFFRTYQIGFLSYLNLVAVLGGVLGVWGIYLLTKELFNWPEAVLAGFLMSFSSWHSSVSRVESWEVWAPTLFTFGLLFLWRGLKGKHSCNFFFSGLLWGLGFYASSSFWLYAVIALIGLLTYLHMLKKDFGNKDYKNSRDFIFRGLVLLITTFFIILLPKLLFNFSINKEVVVNLPPLSLPMAVLVVAGLFRSLIKLFKHWKSHRHFSAIQAILIAWFFIGFYSLNATIVLPAIFILAGESCWWFFTWLKNWYGMRDKHLHEASLVATLTLIIFMISLGFIEFKELFVK